MLVPLTAAVLWLGCADGSRAAPTKCDADDDCGSGRYCVAGFCGDCRSTADCPAAYACVASECVRDSNCSAGDLDNDGDGYVDADCLIPGTTDYGDDCDDTDPAVHPGAPEQCNSIDDDCNGEIDEGLVMRAFYPDQDGDDWGAGTAGPDTGVVVTCRDSVPGMVLNNKDCDDTDSSVHPGAVELNCDGRDEDCNGIVDDVDLDGDGYSGCPMAAVRDCDDADPTVHPGALEVCNGKDDNCNGLVDEGVLTTWYRDVDGDGYGQDAATVEACVAPDGFVAVGADCNDFNANVYPGAPEQCNDLDDDCNGLVDDGLPLLTIYRDNDGDGYASSAAVAFQKCNVPIGWTIAQDRDGDGAAEWDCDDSDVTRYPGAPATCDGKDNDCSGYVDRFCYADCGGSWPFQLTYSSGVTWATPADLDGDGYQEVVVQDDFGFALLSHRGAPFYQYSAPTYNYSRGRAVLADIDDYDVWGPGIQSLEVLTGNASLPTYYKLRSNGTVAGYQAAVGIYDAARFMAADVDNDGRVEFFTTTGCSPTSSTTVFRFDRSTGTIGQVVSIPEPDGQCEFADGRFLSDLDNDGSLEIVFGNGYAYPTIPSYWGGKIYAREFTNPSTLTSTPYCTGCFGTGITGLFPGAVSSLYRFGDEIRAQVVYFQTNVPNQANAAVYQYWTYSLAGQPEAGSPTLTNTLWLDATDVDRDGVPEESADVAYIGLFDVNGDGYPDRVTTSGGELRLEVYDAAQAKLVESPGSRRRVASSGLRVHAAWDMDGDGRLDVLASDPSGRLYCHHLGETTWNKAGVVPPHFPAFKTTYQWDNYEPNEGADVNGDGLPDRYIRVPSALTVRGDFYSFLSSPTDKDYYLIDTDWSANVCVTAPKGLTYDLKVFAFDDLWNNTTHAPTPDGKPDGLVWEDLTADKNQKCFSGSYVTPYRYGEYHFIIGIESHGGASSAHWPYWISAPK